MVVYALLLLSASSPVAIDTAQGTTREWRLVASGVEYPLALAVDPTGVIYVAESGGTVSRVRRQNSQGKWQVLTT